MKSEVEGHVAISRENIPQGLNIISAKWVFPWKTYSNGFITKANVWLVARGFRHQPRVDYVETFAPIAAIQSIKLKVMLAVAVQEGWKLQH